MWNYKGWYCRIWTNKVKGGSVYFSSEEITKVVTSTGIYLIPSPQVFWCPPKHKHQLFFLGEVNTTNLFIDPFWAKMLPSEQAFFDVSSLVKELILKVIKIGTNYPSKGKERRLFSIRQQITILLSNGQIFLMYQQEP